MFLSRFIGSVSCIKNSFLSVCLPYTSCLPVCLSFCPSVFLVVRLDLTVSLYRMCTVSLCLNCSPSAFLTFWESVCQSVLPICLLFSACLVCFLSVYLPICLSFKSILFIRGFSGSSSVQTTLNQKFLKLSIPGFPISCGDIGFNKIYQV